MTDEEIYSRLKAVIEDVFDVDDLVISPSLRARDVPGWDSLGNIRFVLAAEQAFGLRFKTSEVGGRPTLGAFVELLKSKFPE